jgi:hypothetical protein
MSLLYEKPRLVVRSTETDSRMELVGVGDEEKERRVIVSCV